MIGAVIFLSLLQAVGSAPIPVTTLTASKSFPFAIKDQIGRYSDCLTNSSNAAMLAAGGVTEGAQIRRIFAQARIDCAALRAAMATEADLALKRAGLSQHARKQTVEDAFAGADDRGEAFARMVDRTNAERKSQKERGGNVPN
jgi:hypothetical protein